MARRLLLVLSFCLLGFSSLRAETSLKDSSEYFAIFKIESKDSSILIEVKFDLRFNIEGLELLYNKVLQSQFLPPDNLRYIFLLEVEEDYTSKRVDYRLHFTRHSKEDFDSFGICNFYSLQDANKNSVYTMLNFIQKTW